jgi:hypothetical protein
MKGSSGCFEKNSRRQPTRSGPAACVFGEGLTTPHCKKENLLRNVTRGLGVGK